MASFPKKYLPHVAGAAIAALLSASVAFTGPREGETLTAIIPVKGDVPTICNGETHGVYMGMTATHEQCEAMLKGELSKTFNDLFSVVKVPMTDAQAVAFADFIYNEGLGNFDHGSHGRPAILPAINDGQMRQACANLLPWNVMVWGCHRGDLDGKTCSKRFLKGLDDRRKAEFDLCMGGMK